MRFKNMLATLTAGVLVSAAGFSASAAVLVHEPFLSGSNPAAGEYAAGADLGGANPTVAGFSGAWGSTDSGEMLTVGSGLTYAAGSISVGSGGSVSQGNTNFDNTNTSRGTTLGDTITSNGAERWFAALVKAGSDNGDDDSMLVSLDFDTTSDAGTSPFEFGILNTDFYANGATVSGSSYSLGSTALVIGRATVGDPSASSSTSAGIESIDFWFNPTDSSSVSALTSTAAATATDGHNIAFDGQWGGLVAGIEMTTSADQNRMVDEIIVADSLADLNSVITPSNDNGDGAPVVPEPMTAGLACLGLAAAGMRRRR